MDGVVFFIHKSDEPEVVIICKALNEKYMYLYSCSYFNKVFTLKKLYYIKITAPYLGVSAKQESYYPNRNDGLTVFFTCDWCKTIL